MRPRDERASASEAPRPIPPEAPAACPRCRQIKDGDGRLCAYCAREQRIEAEETGL